MTICNQHGTKQAGAKGHSADTHSSRNINTEARQKCEKESQTDRGVRKRARHRGVRKRARHRGVIKRARQRCEKERQTQRCDKESQTKRCEKESQTDRGVRKRARQTEV